MKRKILNYVLISLILIVIVNVFLFPDLLVYAADASTKQNSCENALKWLNSIARFFSWAWIMPAILAGKFMTNSFVFGEVFNMDIYLWKVWNIMKNFANYFIGFVFVFKILATFFQKDSQSALSKFIVKILFASVLVQASWFLVGALVDFSNILTASVGSFSTQFVESSDYRSKIGAIKAGGKCTLDMSSSDFEGISKNCEGGQEVDIEKVLPSYNTLSGPLLYIGYGILGFQNLDFSNGKHYTCGSMTFAETFKSLIVLMFVIPIILILVVNIIRIVYIWIWTILSPLIVLYNVIGKDLFKKADQQDTKKLEVNNIIGLIFQPVAMVAALSFSLILLVGVKSMMLQTGGEKLDFNSFTYSQSGDNAQLQVSFENGFPQPTVQMKGNIFSEIGDTAGGFLGYLILVILTICLLWGVMKVGFTTSQLTSHITGKAFDFMKDMAKAAPILPGGVGVSALSKGVESMKQTATKRVSSEAEGKVISDIVQKFTGQSAGVAPHKIDLQRIITDSPNAPERSDKLFKKLGEIQQTETLRLSTDSALRDVIYEWATSPGMEDYLIRLGIPKEEHSREKLFNNSIFMNIVSAGMGGEISGQQRKESQSNPAVFRDHINSGKSASGIMNTDYTKKQ